MKKTHRAVLSILLVLTLLATLPLTALADTQTVPDNTTVSPPMDVTTDQEMENNTGTIGTNGGTITNNGEPQDDGTNSNPTSGTVQNNFAGGTIVNNYGTVTDNKMETNDPSATIVYNYGIVQNNSGSDGGVAVVENNMAGGIVQNNQAGGTVVNNNAGGTVQYNEAGGTVKYNHGTVGTGGQGGNGNLGTVEYNYIDGVVYNIEDRGEKGTVTTNFGTVHQYNSTTDGTTTTSTTTTFYGLQAVDDEENGAQYYLGSYASNSGEAIDLESKLTDIKRDGYKLVSYTPYTYNKDSNSDDHLEPQTSGNPIFVGKENDTDSNSTSYYITAPTLLKLTWEKIASIFKPAASSGGGGGAEAVELSARKRYIGLGSVIFINEKGYKVVEIKDDAYVVVSFDALSDEDVADLDALYAKLFTPEQQKLIKNVGQLLDSEDVLAVFGTPGNHPVYEISKDLVK